MGYDDVGCGRDLPTFCKNIQFQIQGKGGSRFFWNAGKFLPEHKVSYYRK
jgi:hypothetical protein